MKNSKNAVIEDMYAINSYKSNVTYICAQGYYLDGPEKLVCLEYGDYEELGTGQITFFYIAAFKFCCYVSYFSK